MRVLWITNILLPEALSVLSGDNEIKGSGGWLVGASEALVKKDNIQLYVASVSGLVKEVTRVEGKYVTHYALPVCGGNTRVNRKFEPYWEIIQREVRPDVVHIHGTEFSHALSYLNVCGSSNVVVSVQGLTSVISDYYLGGLTKREILSCITFRDILRGTIFYDAKMFKERGKYEVDILQRVNHVIGRTRWDKSHVWAVNPVAKYYVCNETLRPEFYEGHSWSYNKCVKHSIFLSQAFYPLKGLHMLLKAMPMVLRSYPDATLKIAGPDITKNEKLIEKIKLSGYGNIIRKMIHKSELIGKVQFLGSLAAAQMREEYLRCNVFICPSSIENSPNSLGEAQILGTPIIASYVGGIPDMMRGDEAHLYRYEEVEELANLICQVFMSGDNQVNMKQYAAERHSPEKNCTRLIKIYNEIIN